MKVTNTYEASFYVMFGAKLVDIEVRKLREKKAQKKGYRSQWIMTLENVPAWSKKAWESGYIYGDLVKFSKIRSKIKRWIKAKVENRF